MKGITYGRLLCYFNEASVSTQAERYSISLRGFCYLETAFLYCIKIHRIMAEYTNALSNAYKTLVGKIEVKGRLEISKSGYENNIILDI
jgi:hypothetical protein